MTPTEVIQRCQAIILEAKLQDVAVNATNFLDYANFVRDVIGEWPKKKVKDTLWLKEFALGLRKLRDDFAAIVEADPMVVYKPAHSMALEFHQSCAMVRYFRAPNRTSKTQSGVADNHWVATGQHPYRPRPPLPSAVAVVGTNFSKYCPKTFETKYLLGEGGNPLSPVYPEGGKWFHSYDKRKHIIYLGCAECAEKGNAGACKHAKSSIILFSDVEGPAVLAGGQYAQIQFDEQIQHSFFGESIKRLETVPNSGMIVTETPLGGKGFWTHKVLTRDARAAKKIPGTDRLLVSLHTIDQFSAGLSDPALIKASMELMSGPEIEARVYGRPAAFSETGVFDSHMLGEMQGMTEDPKRVNLYLPEEKDVDGQRPTDLLFWVPQGTKPEIREEEEGHLRIWRDPDPSGQYIIGCDVAHGLLHGDASAASVLRMYHYGHDLHFDQVAQLHGWINPRIYAEECMKLALLYNDAIIVPERRGPGDEMIRTLKELGYWNVFRDVSDPAQNEFSPDPILGLDTNVRTKGQMVAMLQQVIKDRRTGRSTLKVRCIDTLEELGCYSQEVTDLGNVRFNGSSGMHDDRVISLMLAVYAAKAFGIYDHTTDLNRAREEARKNLQPHEREVWDSFRKQQQEEHQYGE